MTTTRLNGLILILWLLLAALIASIAMNAAHFSPWEFVFPTVDPVTWISPTLLVGPPLFLIIARTAPSKIPTAFAATVAAILALVIVAIFVLFSPSAYLGS
jgi:hypothetical protein